MRTLVWLSLVATLAGCVAYTPYAYEPGEPIAADAGLARLRVAVLPAEFDDDVHAAGRGDDGDPLWIALWGVFLPGVWSHESPTRFHGNQGMGIKKQMWVPAKDLVTHAFLSELRAAGPFGVVHLEPADLADYDVVVRPRLTRNQEQRTANNYLLPFVVMMFATVLTGVPIVDLEETLGLRLDARRVGPAADRVTIEEVVATTTQSFGFWAIEEEFNHLWATRLSEVNRELVRRLSVSASAGHWAGDATRPAPEPAPRADLAASLGLPPGDGTDALLRERRELVDLLEEEATLLAQFRHLDVVQRVNAEAGQYVDAEGLRYQLAAVSAAASVASAAGGGSASSASSGGENSTEIAIAKRVARAALKAAAALKTGLVLRDLPPDERPAAALSHGDPELERIYATYLADGSDRDQALARWRERARIPTGD